MNENFDLTKILQDCPKGWKFWSPILGEAEFNRNYGNKGSINISVNKDGTEWYFTSDAKIMIGGIISQEIMIYPSRHLLDWSKFKAPWYKKERFDTKTLKPFDRVLVRKGSCDYWTCDFFSHIIDGNDIDKYITFKSCYKCCIPYNDDTKYLVGTTEEATEYYRYWEE